MCPDAGWKTIASYTPEQTAGFFGGGKLGGPQIHDPELNRRMREQQRYLRKAVYDKVVPALYDALAIDSRQSAERLVELAGPAQRGDRRACTLMAAMIGSLLDFAFMEAE